MPRGRTSREAGRTRWLLESLGPGGMRQWKVPIVARRFRVGREAGIELTLDSAAVSKVHAEIRREDDHLVIRDLESTNGCFVNGVRVSEAVLREGDIVGFADLEFRVSRFDQRGGPLTATVPFGARRPSADVLHGAQHLAALLSQRTATVVFEPVVDLASGAVVGHEALGRGRHPSLPEAPTELFRLASTLEVEAELSRLFRSLIPEAVTGRGLAGRLFVNTHPAELDRLALLGSFLELRERLRDTPLVLEINERAITDLRGIASLKKQLSEVGIGLAYDDFGAGQARLLELAEVPPDYVKFDLTLIRGIDQAPESRRLLLRSLVAACTDLGSRPLAEGVETAEEAEACRALGFTHAQGFFFCPPVVAPH